MRVVLVLVFLDFTCGNPALNIIRYREDVDEWLNKVDNDLLEFNQICTKLTWDMMVYGADENAKTKTKAIAQARLAWKNKICDVHFNSELLTDEQKRKLYLLCRGPKFTEASAKVEMEVLSLMHMAYDLQVCFNSSAPTPLEKLRNPEQDNFGYPQPGECLMAEPDLEYLIKRQDFNPDQLAFLWYTFYDNIASSMREIFPRVVKSQNIVASANGYEDMGALWRDELEMPDIELQVEEFYREIRPLYEIFHSVIRHKLLIKYGREQIDPTGLIPIHLTGNMWGQNWGALIGLFFSSNKSLDLDKRLKEKNWSVSEMAEEAEDFYTSLGLPAMTDKFWKYSIFEERENSTMCHGTAANMFNDDDYRILLCAKVNMEDFYVIHHEMGHIEYNMAYAHQPAVYREGTNSAFHESIGDVIMHGVMVPQHLHRLNLLTDEELLSPDIDMFLLLHQALSKIPEIPFGLLVDEYRWNIFNGKIAEENYNKVYWKMNEELRGIKAPEVRSEEFFDAGAKFHVPDNTPYIRYFLSSILQMQIFKGLCDLSLFGKFQNDAGASMKAEEIKMPLHRCDIYGCKKCGKLLEQAMSLGVSVHWTQVLKMLTGQDYISTKPLLDYYLPVYEWLKKYVEVNDIPIGW